MLVVRMPQIIMIMIMFMDLGVSLALDGQEKKIEISFLSSLFKSIFYLFLLYSGGFF